jgi:pimeloyl-ACP methyl ester carboxylesterase
MQPHDIELPGASGVRLHALEWRPSESTALDGTGHETGKGVGLVFVHGFGNDAHVWDEIAPAVAPHYRTVAMTLRGHGDSGSAPDGDRSTPAMASDIDAATQALGLERFVLIGHSLGGRVAMTFAGRRPERLAGLVIVDSGPDMDARGTTRIRDETRAQLSRPDPSFASPEDYLRVLEAQYPAARHATLEKLAHHWTRRRDDGRYVMKLDLRPPTGPALDPETRRKRAAEEKDAMWAALRALPCPGLVVRGAASDVLAADVADAMVEAMPRGTLVTVPRAGHSVMLDNPEATIDAICGFVLG